MRQMSSRMSGSIGGRPVRFDEYVHFRLSSSRCQRRSVWGMQNDAQRSLGKRPGSNGEYCPIHRAKPWRANLPPKDLQLVTKHKDLDVL